MGVSEVETGVRALTPGHAVVELKKRGRLTGALHSCVHFWLLRIFQFLAP
jgi:hypothetical protein